jgi:riboflavin synthase
MFTGLIDALGEVVSVAARSGSARVTLSTPWPAAEIVLGESIAVDGVCLTVAAKTGKRLEFDAVAETLARTTLGAARPGRRVNLERALLPTDRIGGHLVQGHVDAVAAVARVVARGDDWRVRLRLSAALRPYVAPKGSITLDGVSLTVAGRDRATFEVALVPETLARTTLGALRAGDRVNVEVDLIARYLENLLRAGKGA